MPVRVICSSDTTRQPMGFGPSIWNQNLVQLAPMPSRTEAFFPVSPHQAVTTMKKKLMKYVHPPSTRTPRSPLHFLEVSVRVSRHWREGTLSCSIYDGLESFAPARHTGLASRDIGARSSHRVSSVGLRSTLRANPGMMTSPAGPRPSRERTPPSSALGVGTGDTHTPWTTAPPPAGLVACGMRSSHPYPFGVLGPPGGCVEEVPAPGR